MVRRLGDIAAHVQPEKERSGDRGWFGIGKAIALAFAKQGARVDVLEINTKLLVKRLKRFEARWRCQCRRYDVTRHDRVQEVFDKLGIDRGGLDCLINNAGIAHVGNITNTSEDDFGRVMSVNLKGCSTASRRRAADAKAVAARSSTSPPP